MIRIKFSACLDTSLLKFANPFRHRHRLKACGVEYQIIDGSMLFIHVKPYEGTVVLMRCACGHAESTALRGKWSLEQLGSMGTAETVDAFLESIEPGGAKK